MLQLDKTILLLNEYGFNELNEIDLFKSLEKFKTFN